MGVRTVHGCVQYMGKKVVCSYHQRKYPIFFHCISWTKLFLQYLLTLKLNQSDVLDVFNGIHFLPLDKNTYLRIQCFINLLEANHPQIKYSSFLYNDQLVW